MAHTSSSLSSGVDISENDRRMENANFVTNGLGSNTEDVPEPALNSSDIDVETSDDIQHAVGANSLASAVEEAGASASASCSSAQDDVQLTSDTNADNEFSSFLDVFFPEESTADANGLEPFYFESDHLALKGNEDYRRLLRAFVMLASQRTAALGDLDRLLELQKKALSDPRRFVNELRRGTSRDQFPRPRKVVELPSVSWERYTSDVEMVLNSLSGEHHMTRQKQKRELMNEIRHGIASQSKQRTSEIKTECPDADVPKPASFNQPWTAEEQRHLEKLLQKHPPERFESRRWKKIANELPGRTTQQVASRVQKYFIKLARAGLPVPGRTPNIAMYGGRISLSGNCRNNRYNRFLYPSSTFMTSYEPPVYMSDDDDDDADGMELGAPTGLTSVKSVNCSRVFDNGTASDDDDDDDDDEDDGELASISQDLRETPEFRQLQTLMRFRRRRQQLVADSSIDSLPDGVNNGPSTAAKSEPGVSDQTQLPDFASNAASGLSSAAAAAAFIDPDYTPAKTGISSYLDPNFMPAV